MVQWGEIVQGAGEMFQGLSDVAVIANWMQMDDQGAFNSIEAQIQSSGIDAIDRMDAALLSFANSQFESVAKRRAIKFYAFFKMAEFNRYGFRGFPQ